MRRFCNVDEKALFHCMAFGHDHGVVESMWKTLGSVAWDLRPDHYDVM